MRTRSPADIASCGRTRTRFVAGTCRPVRALRHANISATSRVACARLGAIYPAGASVLMCALHVTGTSSAHDCATRERSGAGYVALGRGVAGNSRATCTQSAAGNVASGGVVTRYSAGTAALALAIDHAARRITTAHTTHASVFADAVDHAGDPGGADNPLAAGVASALTHLTHTREGTEIRTPRSCCCIDPRPGCRLVSHPTTTKAGDRCGYHEGTYPPLVGSQRMLMFTTSVHLLGADAANKKSWRNPSFARLCRANFEQWDRQRCRPVLHPN